MAGPFDMSAGWPPHGDIMAIEVMSRVWDIEAPDLDGSKLLLLLALADYANKDGLCWPSIPSLAKRARVSERQCMRLLRWLADNSYIEVVERGTSKGVTNLYRVLPKGDIQGQSDDGKGDIQGQRRVTSRAKGVTSRATKGDIAMSHQPYKEPSYKEPSTEEPPITTLVSSTSSLRSDVPETAIDPDAVTPPMHPTRTLMLEYEKWLGYIPASYGKESKAAKELLKRGYTPLDVELCYRALKRQPFWASKHLSLMVVLENIAALASYAKGGGDINNTAGKENNMDIVRRAIREMQDDDGTGGSPFVRGLPKHASDH